MVPLMSNAVAGATLSSPLASIDFIDDIDNIIRKRDVVLQKGRLGTEGKFM